MRFFHPNEKFFAWLTREAKKGPKVPIIDCGCGDGDLVLEMRHRGLPAIGIDPMFGVLDDKPLNVELISCVLAMPAEDCSLVHNTRSILLTCRPCHSRFPIAINLNRQPESKLFYVGLEKNIERDLSGTKITEVVKYAVGDEGERIWRIHQ